MRHPDKLRQVWIKGGASSREHIRRAWPELADAIDAVAYRPQGEDLPDIRLDVEAGLKQILGDLYQPPAPRVAAKNGEPRCEARHNPGVWPFVARCVFPLDHERRNDHIDANGKEWATEHCDGCFNIARMKARLPEDDETAHYEFKRAANHHRRECPNR